MKSNITIGITISKYDITFACIMIFIIGKWKINWRALIAEINYYIDLARVTAIIPIENAFRAKLKMKDEKTESLDVTAAFSTVYHRVELSIYFLILVFKTDEAFKKANGWLDYLKRL